jgi:hypothetical protein
LVRLRGTSATAGASYLPDPEDLLIPFVIQISISWVDRVETLVRFAERR